MMTPLGGVLIPRMAYFAGNGMEDEFLAMQRKSFAVMVVSCLPATAGLMLLSHELVNLIAGRGFTESAICMTVTAPIILLIGITTVIGMQILYPKGHDSAVLMCVSLGAVVSLVLNVVLVPRYQHLGAAIATLVAELTILAAEVFLAIRLCKIAFPWSSLLRSILAVIAMGAFVNLIKGESWIRLLTAIGSGAMAYGISMLLMKEPMAMDLMRGITKYFRRNGKVMGEEGQ
jgi:O-antigen/teichoic acid export membrane protein